MLLSGWGCGSVAAPHMSLQIKIRDLVTFLHQNGWQGKNTEGDHHHYIHPTKAGKVTLIGERGDDIGGFLLNSVLRQAGLSLKELRRWLNR
jgi:predicted RNA binding protein YcfA (HicA-like mRNA interferase family)